MAPQPAQQRGVRGVCQQQHDRDDGGSTHGMLGITQVQEPDQMVVAASRGDAGDLQVTAVA
jgi:hypothetical protein